MTKYASKETPFITYQITSAGNALIEKLFFEQEKEMTTIYHLNLDELVMTHYCSLGNQYYFIADPESNENKISLNFIKLENMKNSNEHHIHHHALKFLDNNEMISHWGSWKDQEPFGIDRAFHVYKK